MKSTLIRKIVLPLSVATTNCGDTNNHYYIGNEEQAQDALSIKDCNDVAARLYECNYKNVQSEGKWDAIVLECSPERVDFFKNAPSWIKCISENDCTYINSGACDQYMIDY